MQTRSSPHVALLCALLALATAPLSTQAQNSQPIRTIYLVRHGAYLPDPKANPQSGPGLSTLGIAQARLVATRFRSMPIAFDSLTSSTMTRAQQTTAVVHEQIADVSASASPLLSECTPPARMPLRDPPASLSACKERLDAAFAKFFTPAVGQNRNDILVCHGNVIRYLTTKALGVDGGSWVAMSVGHTSLTVIQVLGNDVFRIVSVGDIGHLPSTLQSWGDDADPNLVAPSIEGVNAVR